MATQTWESLKFIGPGSATVANWFRDQFTPAPAKNEWGVDTLLRELRGPASLYEELIEGLNQGDTFPFGGATFYLQSWNEMADPVFPGVRLNYKGLISGLPAPIGSNSTGTKTATKSANIESALVATQVNPGATGSTVSAIRTIEYYAPETQWRYITSGKPSGASYSTINNSAAAVVKRSRLAVTVEGVEAVFAGNAPAPVVSATAMSAAATVVSHSATEIIGTPWWECIDTVALEYQGDS